MRMELPTVNLWLETIETDKTGQTDKTDEADKTGQTYKTDETDKTGQTNKTDKTDETDKTGQTNKTDKIGETNKIDKANKTDKSNKIDKTNKTKKIYKAYTGNVKRHWGCKRLAGILCAVLMMACLLAGCGMVTVSEEKIRDLDYTVLSEKELPKELLALISQKKVESFKMTFEDKGFLYICQGYGEQPTAGYSICVDDAYVTSNAIYFATSLIGPDAGEPKTTQPTYPYIVIKTEMQDGTVVFGD